MMSSSPETTTRTTGARQAHSEACDARREAREAGQAREAQEARQARDTREARDRAAARAIAQRTPARYEPYLDGLFTYCLSVLCDHDAATAALADALTVAERRGHRLPGSADDLRAWLYALSRWSCLRKLAEPKQRRQGAHAAGRGGAERGAGRGAGVDAGAGAGVGRSVGRGSGREDGNGVPQAAAAPEAEERRHRELALLAWPEAAGTTPEQREALELAVRHRLPAHEVAAVLGMQPAAARELLASAACEVERTRAALAVVEAGGCPGVTHLTGDGRLVLGAALRQELVRHVDDCPRCRRTAERAVPGRWPGAMVTPAELPVLQAPRAALHMALAHQPRARGAAVPRFDRRGFPMGPKDRAARRERMRARAVTTTVVATVVAAPVLALWAAYRGGPAGEGDGPSATAREAQGPDVLGDGPAGTYENAGSSRAKAGPRIRSDGKADVSVQVVSVGGPGRGDAARLTVGAANDGDTTLITLTASSGASDIRWSVSTSAAWLYFSRSSGTLAPGRTLTVKVYVDHLREPSGPWHARVAVAPAGAVVSIDGYGTAPSRPAPRPSSAPPSPAPSAPATPPPASSSPPPDPTPPPSSPPPSTPETPAPTAPATETPSPSGS
ncbi:BACON domain-containing protein [Streptomyces achromogenes]|uniref:BACON domain-containing protein n=1 Tax=Streptomyces achromogenes TaxID=67255 RepID=UPI003F4CEF91